MYTFLLQCNHGREDVLVIKAVQWAVSDLRTRAGGEGTGLVCHPFLMAELWKELGKRTL